MTPGRVSAVMATAAPGERGRVHRNRNQTAEGFIKAQVLEEWTTETVEPGGFRPMIEKQA